MTSVGNKNAINGFYFAQIKAFMSPSRGSSSIRFFTGDRGELVVTQWPRFLV